DLSPEQREALRFELERTRRIRLDYSLTEDELKSSLQKKLPEGVYSDDAYEKWKEEGYFDFKLIDSETLRYFRPSVANFFFRHDTIKPADFKPGLTKWESFLLAEAERVIAEVETSPTRTAQPRDFEIWFRATMKPEITLKEGSTLRAWIPFPQEFAFQTHVDLLETLPVVEQIAPNGSTHRSLYFEETITATHSPREFYARWSMTRFPQYTNIDPARVPLVQNTQGMESFLSEQLPHVVFTPELLALEQEISLGVTNPAEKARAYYEWISHNIKYSYAHEYSTVHNISDFVRSNSYGDCGQIALLFITLCRAGGVPARFSAGWVIYPMYTGMHDWAEIYLEPYGWVHVDANWGIFIERDFDGLSREKRDLLKNYYFGGIDAYRLTISRDHGKPHVPAKTDFRSDTVDFQRGEYELDGRNIYFPEFAYSLSVQYHDGHTKHSGAFD
ncbi:MAG: transglutaminase-like domain-containing protein, partial [Candidatus Sumerlaeia bacterium]|nr:transglutaminase-like domain-containing protein [Candidatus Sumerlaeia bacterium]